MYYRDMQSITQASSEDNLSSTSVNPLHTDNAPQALAIIVRMLAMMVTVKGRPKATSAAGASAGRGLSSRLMKQGR